MGKKKIYLETTLFNHYFDIRTPNYHDDTRTLFNACAEGTFKPYTSHYVVEELEAAPREKYDQMFDLTKRYDIMILDTSDDANKLARQYLFEGALPKNSLTDAIHIAVASINELDTIISLNFRHIVREKTIKLTNEINISLGYNTIEINSPKEALDYEIYR